MKMGKQQWLSSTQPTALFERSVGVLWGVNMTITDRLPGESCMRPALQLVVVGSLLCYTNKDDFSMPQVKMRYVIAVLTLRQVCFRLWTMSCVTASSEMCRAQRWDLDDSCCAGAIDGVQGQGWIMGMWQRSNLWVQAKESVCGLHLNNIETTFPRLRPQVQRKLPRKATRLQAKTLETQQQLRWHFEWWCCGKISAKEDLGVPIHIRRGETHRGPLPGWFLRWPEKGRNQVRLFLRPNQRITTKKDMCSAPPPPLLWPPYSIRPAWLDTGSQ